MANGLLRGDSDSMDAQELVVGDLGPEILDLASDDDLIDVVAARQKDREKKDPRLHVALALPHIPPCSFLVYPKQSRYARLSIV
jgi:hypothetical protein